MRALGVGQADRLAGHGQRRGVLVQADPHVAGGDQVGGDRDFFRADRADGFEVGQPVGGQDLYGSLSAGIASGRSRLCGSSRGPAGRATARRGRPYGPGRRARRWLRSPQDDTHARVMATVSSG